MDMPDTRAESAESSAKAGGETSFLSEHGRYPYLLRRALWSFEQNLRRELVLSMGNASLGTHYALTVLLCEGTHSVTALAEKIGLQQPTTTKLLDRLVRDGLVSRRQDSKDRRIARVSLTERGVGAANALMGAERRAEQEALRMIGPYRRGAMIEALRDGAAVAESLRDRAAGKS